MRDPELGYLIMIPHFLRPCTMRAAQSVATNAVGYAARNAMHLVNLPNVAAAAVGGVAFYGVEQGAKQVGRMLNLSPLFVPVTARHDVIYRDVQVVFKGAAQAALGAAILGVCGIGASPIPTAMAAAIVGAAVVCTGRSVCDLVVAMRPAQR